MLGHFFEEYKESEPAITHDNESMNGNLDTETVYSIKIAERVNDMNDQPVVEEDNDSDDEEKDTHLKDYSYGLNEMDITK